MAKGLFCWKILGGFNFVRLRYLGEKYVLLSCEEEGVIQKSIAKNKDRLEGVFNSLVLWDVSFVVKDKIVWVRCRGIPLALRSSECFERIGNHVGTFVEVVEACVAKEVLRVHSFVCQNTIGR